MSCYEWERGTIVIPAKEWAGFRKGLLEAWNKRQLALLERAKRVHASIKDAVKGKCGPGRASALRSAIERHIGQDEGMHGLVLVYDDAKWCSVLRGGQPQKKDLDLCAVSKDAEISLPDAHVSLRNKGRMVTWDVGENNHARDHAHKHWFAELLFQKLDMITWTRGTGGKILGNDEYNRDEGGDHEGGGGSYVTREYRVLTAKEKREAAARQREAARCNYGGYGGRSRLY